MAEETIRYYNEHAVEFVSSTINADVKSLRRRFLHHLPAQGKILDAGCGSGRDTIAFLAEGYLVDAFDASEEMCRIASENTGISVSRKCFEELDGSEEYDGIWASASLLHVKKEQLPGVLENLNQLLKPEGVLYASFKRGEGELMRGERYFYDMTEGECVLLMQDAGFSVLEVFCTADVRPERKDEQWVNIIVRKPLKDYYKT